jgi:hypothetical protein
MDRARSYASKTFVVTDPDARIRNPDKLTEFVKAPGGGFTKIPQGAVVRIDDHRIVATGASNKVIVFVRALSEDGAVLGWTSGRNFKGEFINETLGATKPPQGASKKGPFAAWAGGAFIKQVTLVTILDAGYELAYLSMDTIEAYFGLVEAAASAGVTIKINSGFRSYPEQEALRKLYDKDPKKYAKAAKAGFSNHQSGVAFDIVVAGGTGNPTYDWLCANAPARGFLRTVNNEPWHWEYKPDKAAAALAKGTFKAPGVVDG